jgi:hypothetical protein
VSSEKKIEPPKPVFKPKEQEAFDRIFGTKEKKK